MDTKRSNNSVFHGCIFKHFAIQICDIFISLKSDGFIFCLPKDICFSYGQLTHNMCYMDTSLTLSLFGPFLTTSKVLHFLPQFFFSPFTLLRLQHHLRIKHM